MSRWSFPKSSAMVSACLLLMSAPLLVSAATAADTAKATPEIRSALSVRLVQPTRVDWTETVTANGWLAPWHEATIAAEASNLKIVEIFVDIGDVVVAGQKLLRLADEGLLADLHKQEAAVAQAEAALAEAQANAGRARTVTGSGALSEKDIKSYLITERKAEASLASEKAALESTRIKLDQATVVAPDDGVITSRSASLGNVVAAGSELFRLLRQRRVEWQAELDETQIARVRIGQAAVIDLPGDRHLGGTVRLIAPSVNKGTGRTVVYVALPVDEGTRQGLYVSGRIELGNQPALTVPESAVVPRDGLNYVFVAADGGRVRRLKVSIGRRLDGRIEILDGVAADARVVESGGAFLADGAVVTILQ